MSNEGEEGADEEAPSMWAQNLLLQGYLSQLTRAALSGDGFGRNLTDRELAALACMGLNAANYGLHAALCVLWYTRVTKLVPGFLQVCARMTACWLFTALFLHDQVWVQWYGQPSLQQSFLDVVQPANEQTQA